MAERNAGSRESHDTGNHGDLDRRAIDPLSAAGSWEWDPEADRLVISDQLYRLLGLDPRTVTRGPRDFWARLHPDDLPGTRAAWRRAIQTGEPFIHEHRVLRADGEQRVLQSRGRPSEAPPGGKRLVGACWDITDLYQWALRDGRERSAALLRATLDATADGIVVIDRNGELVTFNERFLKMWNIPPEFARSASNQELIHFVKDQVLDPETLVETTRQNHAHPEGEYFLAMRLQDGRVFERFSRPQLLGDEIIGRVLTLRDVTEKERLIDQAQDAVRLRDEFLSIAAHEIRGPITSMRLAVQSLRAGSLPAEALPQSLDIIDRSQRRLADFVEKLLDLGRIQTGALQLDLESMDLAEVAREVVSRHVVELQRSGSTVRLSADTAVVGNWDRVRLDQVVTNLLSNAIKFGQGRPIVVQVSAGEGGATLLVRDDGIGIPPEIQERIFRPFQRGVSIRHYGGLGLGLHIVQTIVDALGGRIELTSQPGSGSTFRIELPRAASAPERVTSAAADRASAAVDCPSGQA
jgi:PAS domain S-box-containing protein